MDLGGRDPRTHVLGYHCQALATSGFVTGAAPDCNASADSGYSIKIERRESKGYASRWVGAGLRFWRVGRVTVPLGQVPSVVWEYLYATACNTTRGRKQQKNAAEKSPDESDDTSRFKPGS